MQAFPLALLAALAAVSAPGVGAYHLVPRGSLLQKDVPAAAHGAAANGSSHGAALAPRRGEVAWAGSLPEWIAQPWNGSDAQDFNISEIDSLREHIEEILEPRRGRRELRWGPPIWRTSDKAAHNTTKSSKELFREFWGIEWHKLVALFGGMILALLVDIYLLQVYLPQVRLRNLVLQPLLWVLCAAAFLTTVLAAYTAHDGVEWLTGYIYEWVFQLDNLLVCHIIFQRYKVPRKLANKALTMLLVGQLFNRVLFYLGLAHVIHGVALFRYGAGLILVYGGYHTVREPLPHQAKPAESEEGQSSALTAAAGSLLQKLGRHAAALAGGSWGVLFPAVGSMYLVDLVLGADCAIAKIEEIDSTYWNITSSAIALFGLKASYSVLADAADRLVYIQYGIGAVLIFIGVELLLMSWIDIGSFASIATAAGLMAACALASLCCGPGLGGRGAAGDPRVLLAREPGEEPEEATKNAEDSDGDRTTADDCGSACASPAQD